MSEKINPQWEKATHRFYVGDLTPVNVGPPPISTELICDKQAIHEELKKDRERRTKRVTSKLP